MKPKNTLRFIQLAGSALLATSPAHAADGTWNGITGNWTDTTISGGVWAGGTIADLANFTAYFTGVDIAVDQIITLNGNRTIGNITFTDATTSSHNLTITGSILTLDRTSGVPLIDATQSDRTLTISSIVAGNDGIQKNGSGTLTLTGNNTCTGTTNITAGALKLQGGAFSTTARTYSISSGAILNLDGGASIAPTTNSTINGTGTLRITGGTLAAGATSAKLNMSLGAGGLIDIQVGGSTAGYYQGVNWTSNLASLKLDGSFELWNGPSPTVDALTGSGSITKGNADGAYGGFATNTITVGAANGSGTFSGTISRTAGTINLTKNGTGTQTLSGANSYNGATTVNGGTLLLDKTGTGALASTSTLTLGGGIFKVLGKSGAFTTAQTLGALTLNAGGSQIVLDANGGTNTTLTMANSAPTRAAGGTLAMDLSIANTVLASTLGLAADSQTNTQAILGYATVKDATSTGFATNVGGNIVRYTGAEELLAASNNSTTNYKITPLGTTTTGSPLLTTAASAAYNSLGIDTSGASGANFLSLDGTVSLTRNALLMTGGNDFTIQGGTQLGAAGSELIVHQAGAGTLTISSLISSGAGSLTKSGTGILVLSGNNAYTGATNVNAGTLRLQGGAFSTTANRTYSVASGAVLNLASTTNVASTINGAGTLRINGGLSAGAGSRVINMNLGVGGLIDIQSGGSIAQYYQGFGWASNKATLNVDGSMDFWDGASVNAAALTGSGAITSTANTDSNGGREFTLGVENGSGTFTGSITAAGTRNMNLIKTGNGTQVFSGSTLFKGVTTLIGGTLQYAKTASLNAGNSANWTAARINVKSGATLAVNVDSAGTNGFTDANLNTLLGNLSTSINSATVGLQAGANLGFDTSTATAGTFTQGNVIANSTGSSGGVIGVTKLGTGTLVLDKANTYTGSTTISGGTLLINGNQSTSNGAVSVAADTTLGGSGTIGGNVTVAATAKLTPGNSAVGTLNLAANLIFTVASGDVGTLDFELGANNALSSDRIAVTGTLDIGTAALDLNDFNFANLGGLENGTYPLISTGNPVTGTLGPATNGTFGGATIVLQKSLDGTDIELVVSGLGGGLPEIAVEQNSVDIPNSTGSKSFGTATIGSNNDLVFTVLNTGGAGLNLSGAPDLVAVSGHPDFTVTVQPATNPVPATSGSTTFTVRFTPQASGARSATVSIANDDSDENPFTFTVSGTGQTPYEAWAGGAAFNADANGDGVKNGLAFLLGASGPNANALDKLPTVSESGGALTLSFNCLPVAARGTASLKVAHSTNLGSWTATTDVVPDANDPTPDNNVTFVVGAGPAGPPALKSVTATIGSAAAAGGKLFGHLEATP